MPALSDYTAGTITLTNGSTAFTGSGTGWQAADFREGDTILGIEANGGAEYVVETITGNAAGTLTQPWEGASGTYTYRMRYLADGARVTAQARELIELLGNGNLQSIGGLTGPGVVVLEGPHSAGIRPFTDFINGVAYDVQVDTLPDRAAYDGQAAGFAVLVSDVGDGRSAIYSKNTNTSGDWSDPAYITGPVGPTVTIETGTTTTLPPGSNATFGVAPVTGGYALNVGIPAGAGFLSRGAYVGATAYVKGDVVQNNNSSWIAKIATTGNAPPVLPTTSNTWWELLAAKGLDGTGTGDVQGPASSTAGGLVAFSGTTGKQLSDTGFSIRNAIPFPSGTSTDDFNTILAPGWHNGLVRGGPSYSANSPPYPDGGYWFVENQTYGSGTPLSQIAWPYGPSKTTFPTLVPMVRSTNSAGTTWSTWGPLAGDVVTSDQNLTFYSTLALEQAEDRTYGPVVAGPDGNGIFDGFNTLSYVDVAGSTALDTSVSGEIRPGQSTASVYTDTLPSTSNDFPNFNHRLWIAASQISASGNLIRLQLSGPATGSTVITALWFGHKAASGDEYDFDGTQVQVQMGGVNGFTVAAGATVFTDWFAYPLNSSRDVVISFHTSTANMRRSNALQSVKRWWTKEAASEAGVSNVSGYTGSGAYSTSLVSIIQTGSPANMTLVSSPLTLSAVPAWSRFFAFVNLGTATLNTDFRVQIARNGSTFATVTAEVLYLRPGGFAVIATPRTAISVAAGTTGRWRLNTFNNVSVRVAAAGVIFGV